jgi:uncharacterized spore protein YtfJ
MDINFDALFEKVLEHLRTVVKTETVMGQQFQLGEFSVVPVMKASLGFGSGGGVGDSDKQGKGTGGGAGAGLNIEPVAFLVSKGDDISILNVGKGKGIESLFDKAPEIMGKVIDMKEAFDGKKKKEEKESSEEE